MRTLLQIIAVSLIFFGDISAQIAFEPASEKVTQGFRSGSPVVCIDMNNDGLDDLVRLDEGTELCVDLSHGDGQFTEVYRESVANNGQWNLMAADVNQDGFPDIVTSGVSDRVKVYLNDGTATNFARTVIDDERFFAQASNIADVNGDGFMDIFVCDDNAINKLYTGEGNGTFNRNDTLIDFRTVPESDNSGNYGSVWTDFDLDGDLDLYISKCRVGVFDPTDPRRVNMLFEQTEDGFVESAAKYGLASGGQSWSADFADCDNDGDFDVVIINHDVAAEMLEYDGDTLRDITESSGIDITGVIIQSIFRDFDNDGLVDLFVSGSIPKLYHNKGNMVFEEVENPFPGAAVSSFTLGDFNGDGYPDVYATYNELYNTPSDLTDDRIWMNTGGDNNWVRMRLIGSENNMNAVGAKIYVHANGVTQLREIRAGESYGIGTSLIQNVGLGQADMIDSLVVIWPDGESETFQLPETNTLYNVFKNGCATPSVDLGIDAITLCTPETGALLTAPEGFVSYEWSNGMTEREIAIMDPGFYHVTMTDDNGCESVSYAVPVLENNEPDSTSITLVGASVKCRGASITLLAPEGNGYLWSNGASTQGILASESGVYSVTVTRTCTDAIPEGIEVTLVDPGLLPTQGDSVLPGATGQLTAEGDSVIWFDAVTGNNVVGEGNQLEVIAPENDTTIVYYAEQYELLEGVSFSGGQENHIGPDKYNGNTFNGGVSFDALTDFTLDSVKVYTEFAGLREIILLDSADNQVASRVVMIDSGVTYVPLMMDVVAAPGYVLTTNGEQNIETFGFASPRLYRSTQGVEFPYRTEEVIEVNSAGFGSGRYYYFYDFRVTTLDQYCVGLRNGVTLTVRDTSTSVRDLDRVDLVAYPNPVSNVLTIQGWDNSNSLNFRATYLIRTLDGKTVASGNFTSDNDQISTADLQAGMYLLEIYSDERFGSLKFIKQ